MGGLFFLTMGVFLALAAIGAPLGYAMFASGVAYLLIAGRDVGLAGEQILSNMFSGYVLLAVPLFIFAATVMNAGAVSDRLLRFCLQLVGRLRGGLAHVNIVTSVIFAGMSGSAIADAAGVGKLMISMMTREGRYPRGFAAAITAASAVIGPIIPPSIPMVLYALVSSTSIGYLFLGGVLPGFLIAAVLMVAVAVQARRRGFPVERGLSWRELPRETAAAFPALLLPVILLGAIYGGATTPTEAAAVAAAYALLIAVVVYRTMGWRTFRESLAESTKATAVVATIVAGAYVFNYIVAIEQIPNALAAAVTGVELSPTALLLIVSVAFLVFGCFLDATTMLLVLVPLIMPSVRAAGIDPVHFGVVIVVNMMIGLITPPYGVLLFVLNSVTGIPLREIIREIWVFIAVLITGLLVMLLVPDVVLWLPQQFGYGG